MFIPEAYLKRTELSDRLKRIIFHLSDSQRETIMLYYYQGMSSKEIAQIFGCS